MDTTKTFRFFFVLIIACGWCTVANAQKTPGKLPHTKATIKALKDSINIDRKVNKLKRRYNRIKHRSDSPFFIDSTKTIVYDFKTKKFLRSNVEPHINEPLVFKVININRLAYDIEFKSENTAINDEFLSGSKATAPPEIQETKPQEETKEKAIDAPTLTAASQQSIPTTNKKNQESEANALVKNADNEIAPLQDLIKKNNLNIETIKKAIESLAAVQDTISILTKKKEILTLEQENQSAIASIAGVKDKLVAELKVKELAFKAAQVRFDDIHEKYVNLVARSQKLTQIENHYEDYRCLVQNPLLDQKYYYKLRDEKFFIFNYISDYRKEIAEFQYQHEQLVVQYNQVMNDWQIIGPLEQNVKESFTSKLQIIKEEADKMKAKFDAADLTSKLRKVYAIDRILYNKEGYMAASAPIQPLEDFVTFNVTIKNRDSKKHAEYEDPMVINHIEYTKGGVRFDFSTGIAFDFPLDKQDKDDDDYYDAYEVLDVKNVAYVDGVPTFNTVGKQIRGTSKNTFKPSLAALFHTSFRTTNYVALGLTLGASLNVEQLDLNSLYLGPSLLLGKKQKFILTCGPAFKQLDVLKKNYSLNVLYPTDAFNESSVLTSKQFRIGLFFAVTYNLTQAQKSNFKLVK